MLVTKEEGVVYIHAQPLSRVQLFATPWTVAHLGPPSMGFSRQEHWSGCHFLFQGIFLAQGSNLYLLHCKQILYPLSHCECVNMYLYMHVCNYVCVFMLMPADVGKD